MFQPSVDNPSNIVYIMEKKIEKMIWALIGLVIVVAAVAIAMFVLFSGRYDSGSFGPYGMMGGYGFYGFGIFMPIIGVVTFIFIILFVYFLLKAMDGSDREYPMINTGSAENIAKERFARGEITEEEYNGLIEKIRR